VTLYEVGKPYPGGLRLRYDGSQYNYRAGSHELLLFIDRPRPAELRAMQEGPWEFALLVRPEVLFLLYKPGSMPWSDAPYSWWRVKERLPEEAVPPFELPTPASRALLSVILVDTRDGIVRLIKAVTFSPEFSRLLHAAIGAQIDREEPPREEYEQAVARYYAIYWDSDDMLPAVAARCTGGEE